MLSNRAGAHWTSEALRVFSMSPAALENLFGSLAVGWPASSSVCVCVFVHVVET